MKNSFLVIDAGGTQIKLGHFVNGDLIETASIPSFSNYDINDRLANISAVFRSWVSTEETSCIGLAFAGIVDFEKAKITSVNDKFKDATSFDFVSWADKEFGCPIVMENDARAALIGEWKYGAARNFDNIVMVTLGTGIGGSAIINGNILRGVHNQAGCLLGHFTIDYEGELCNCGNIGCVETIGSTWALPGHAKNAVNYKESLLSSAEKIDFDALFRLSKKEDPLSLQLREKCLKSWAVAAVNAIHAYDPEVVVLGGGVMKSGEIIHQYIKKHVEKYAWTPWGEVTIKNAELGNNAALWGMHYLIHEKQKK